MGLPDGQINSDRICEEAYGKIPKSGMFVYKKVLVKDEAKKWGDGLGASNICPNYVCPLYPPKKEQGNQGNQEEQDGQGEKVKGRNLLRPMPYANTKDKERWDDSNRMMPSGEGQKMKQYASGCPLGEWEKGLQKSWQQGPRMMPEGESGNRGKVESPKIKIKVIKEIARKGAEEYQSMPRDNHRIQPETKGTKMMANYLMPKEKEVSKEKKNFSTSKRASEENGMKGKEIKVTAPLWMNQKNAQQIL